MPETFTPEARGLWEAIPEETRFLLLANVWCVRCARPTTIVDFLGRVESGDLVLEGECERCGAAVGRLIESS